MENVTALILAAGEGKRMKSKNAKVTHMLSGKPMIQWVYSAANAAGVNDCIVIIGHKAEQVREALREDACYVMQQQQLGTGHAIMQAKELLEKRKGHVLVLYGDTPLITGETISKIISHHIQKGNSATVATTYVDNPQGYGRIVRDNGGNMSGIVEDKDASSCQKSINEINTGVYCFAIDDLLRSFPKLNNNNSQAEYYATDLISILISDNKKVGAVKIDNPEEMLGVNNRVQLYEASNILRNRILKKLMESGVTIIDPQSTYIDDTVKIGIDTVIYPGTFIEGESVVGEDCIIGPNTRIINTVIANCVEVQNSIVIDSKIGEGTHVGPFAYLRPGAEIGKNVRIGDFVEIKKSTVGDKTKIAHLTYVGDAQVGSNVNVGCGVVFVNYDGKNKNKTIVGDNAFIGSNVNLIAPLIVNDNGFIAAGSTITDEVPQNALAIARERQVIKQNWVIEKGMNRR